ncbi:MAG: DMT family transporter [Alistipes sp.]|nr:DMT family transporter [Alistipes senegalensis]MCM1249630.1 DMT family transporter [Alistipes sp.]
MNRFQRHKWLIFALITTLTWGVWGEFSELIQQEGFPAGMVYTVWAFSMVPCAVVALWIGGWKIDRSPKSLLLGLSTGLLGAGGQLVLFEALRHGPAYIVFPFVSMSPVVTIALSLVLLRERANRIQTAGIAVALAAIFFLSWQESGGSHADGYLWLVLAAIVFIAWGVQGYIMKFANHSMSAESIFFYMALTGVMLVPAALAMTGMPEAIAPSLYVKGFFTQMLNSIGALTLVYAYRYGKAIIVSPMQGLAPLITMVLSLVLFAVIPGPMLLTGLVLATIALVALSIE